MHGPKTAGAGWPLPARVGPTARNPGSDQQSGRQSGVGLEVIFVLGVVAGMAGLKTAQLAKKEIRRRLSEEMASILEDRES